MSKLDCTRIVKRFHNHTLPKPEWTHQAHLVMGLHSLLTLGLEQSIHVMREGIKSYNLSVGTQNTDTGGYHESITIFFLHALSAFIEQNEEELGLDELVEKLDGSLLMERPFILQFYSKEHIFSVQARREWVKPDIQPLSALSQISLHPDFALDSQVT